jgi:hypothetical protein
MLRALHWSLKGGAIQLTKLSVLLFKEDDWWLAQCLEYDLCSQAKTPEDVLYEFERTLLAQILISIEANEEPLAGIDPAPEEYWKRFHASGVQAQIIKRLPFRLPANITLQLSEEKLEVRLAA